jgi:hypothetical protein
MYRIISCLILCDIFWKKLVATQVETNIGIYCSTEIYLVDRYYHICRWLFANGTSYYDTYKSATQDCPNGYIFGGLINITNLKIEYKNCNSFIKIWIDEISSNNFNSMIIHSNGSIELLHELPSLLYDGFLCLNKSQEINCASDEYLDESSMICKRLNNCYLPQSYTLSSAILKCHDCK